MRGGAFVTRVDAHDPPELSETGNDEVEFLVSANPGQPPRPLAKVASGGELSRISLALQVATLQGDHLPCLVFDEVDAGVGGAVAERVGRQLAQLATQAQVLCVTHLPQVAAQAEHQVRVTKLSETGRTRTRLERLDEPAASRKSHGCSAARPITDAHARTRARDAANRGRVPQRAAAGSARYFAARAVRAVRADAMAVQSQRVVGELEPEPRGDLLLALLDAVVAELLDPPAVRADDVVVVHALVEFEHRRAALEMMPRDDARRLELREHPVNGGEPDVLVQVEQAAVDILGAHVPQGAAARENFEDLDPGIGDLQSGTA